MFPLRRARPAALAAVAIAFAGCGGPTADRCRMLPAIAPPIVTGAWGKLSKSAIRAVADRHRAERQACYERRVNRRAAGCVVVNFLVHADASVTHVTLNNSTLGEPAVEACLIEAVARWQFPEPEDGNVYVTAPFEFDPPAPSPAVCTIPAGAYAIGYADAGGDCPRDVVASVVGFTQRLDLAAGQTCGDHALVPSTTTHPDGCTTTMRTSLEGTAAGLGAGTMVFEQTCANGSRCTERFAASARPRPESPAPPPQPN